MPDPSPHDELDPTAPPVFAEVEVVDVVDGQEPDDDIAWSLETGFHDETGTVRVWTDVDGNPERVQLARYWRDQVQRVPLEAMFADVFMQINILLGSDAASPPDPRLPPSDELLSRELVAECNSRMAELAERLKQLDETGEGYPVVEGQGCEGSAEDGRVRLRLTVAGTLDSVAFDPKWLKDASTAVVCRAVIEAHRDARGGFVPPVIRAGERAHITDELFSISRRIEQAAARGIAGVRQASPEEVAAVMAEENR
ncbi:hypothetical protein GCM10009785_24740 [Brooklawnia cerclae]|uniref:DNA-binding protein YbaB n=1 Tax=Brooklawnia cerclae TaxID=349934 RepID=A0ABX0SAZ1_9ACTN|nr:hypothetical protein [Brooklawnia cerclae]NIH55563.1 DNA-binding protein YbaB [Brooklawnia cerclae]